MTDLLKLLDLTGDEIKEILRYADQLKYERKHGIEHKILAGKTLGMIFKKASTRTRLSFEVGMYQLGGHALFLAENTMQIGRGEPVEDTARVMERYLDGIMIRTFEQAEVETLAKYARIPVINGLTDFAHPCQVLADLMTVREYKGKLEGIKLCYIGDGNNMANSLIVGGLKTGMKVSVATPADYKPDPAVLEFAQTKEFTWTEDIYEAAREADVLYTDVWSSMGMEAEAERRMHDFRGYCVDEGLLKAAKNDAIVLHCLPAHRGEEVVDAVIDGKQSRVWDEAENRVHAQKSVLLWALGKL